MIDSHLYPKVEELPSARQTGRGARTSEVLGDKQKQYNPQTNLSRISMKASGVMKCSSPGGGGGGYYEDGIVSV